jgi:hypothetical protein
MKIIDLLNAQPVIQALIERKMPAKLAYAIAKNFRLITSELEDYDKTRLKLLSDNWTLNEETGKYDIPDSEAGKWKTLHDDLIQTECGYQPYKIDLSLTEQLDWSPAELLSLWFIFQGDGSSDLAPVNGKKVE